MGFCLTLVQHLSGLLTYAFILNCNVDHFLMLRVVLLYSACTQFCNVLVYVIVSLTVGEKILEFSTDKAKGEKNICGSDGRSLVITLYLFVLFLASNVIPSKFSCIRYTL